MKRNLLIAIAFLLIAFTPCRAQLSNTTWSNYYPSGTPFCYFHFASDTLSYSFDSISYTNISTYQVAGNNFTILDVPSGICYGDTGTYTFSIQNDTLNFVLASDDSCANRVTIFVDHHWVRLLSGIPDINFTNRINIFPNPFVTETVLQSDIFLHNATLNITTISGQIVRQVKNISGQIITLNRNDLQSGIYFIQLMEENKIISVKKIAIAD